MSERRGWGWPVNSRKAHYFDGNESLCRRWLFLGSLDQPQGIGEKPGPDDCAECWRKAKAAQS